MVTREHTQIVFAVHEAIGTALRRMGLNQAAHHYQGVDIDVNGQSKHADMGWGPRRPPRGYPKRPTVVLEVTVSETERKLHHDVDLWLDPLRGNASVAMAIKVNRQRPMTDIKMWVWDHVNGKSHRSHHIQVLESETDGVNLSRGPLVSKRNQSGNR